MLTYFASSELCESRGGRPGLSAFPNSPYDFCADVQLLLKCCITSTETLRTIRDGHLDFHIIKILIS